MRDEVDVFPQNDMRGSRCLGETQQQTRLDDKGRVHLKKKKAT